MQKKFCTECGAALLENAGFCPDCGSKVIQNTESRSNDDYDFNNDSYNDGYDNLDLDDEEKDFIRRNSVNPNQRGAARQQRTNRQPQAAKNKRHINNNSTNTKKEAIAIAALVCGILSIVLFMSVGVIFALVGLALSIICLIKKKNPYAFAIAGLVCSIIGCMMLTVKDNNTKKPADAENTMSSVETANENISKENEADKEISLIDETKETKSEEKIANTENVAKQIEDKVKKDNPIDKLSDDLNIDMLDSSASYESIYDEYVKKIKDATPALIEEYKNEAKDNNSGIEGLAELSNKKVEKLAEISNEGVEKMASYMYTHGKGNYDEYEEWSTKLYDVYMEESQKIMDEYMNSAMGDLGL